jgi:Cu-Zn family superoxide dismutase
MIRMRTALAGLAALALAATAAISSAQADDDDSGRRSQATKVFPLAPSTLGDNPEGVAWDRASRTFFVGSVASGTIYRAGLRDSTLRPFITPSPAAPADSAFGLKVAGGKLYVAGGPTGSIYVYDIATGALNARFETGAGGFLNDLVVTRGGDVYVTDSFRPTLWRLSRAMVVAGSGTPQAIPVSPEIAYTAGQFNLNGIVAREGGRSLIVVSSFSQSLYRIKLGSSPTTRTITPIQAPRLPGDGLLIDRGRLLVVTGNPAQVAVLTLDRHDSRARSEGVLTDPSLRGPSTIARAQDRYLVVNADFALNRQPYTVSSLPVGSLDHDVDEGEDDDHEGDDDD